MLFNLLHFEIWALFLSLLSYQLIGLHNVAFGYKVIFLNKIYFIREYIAILNAFRDSWHRSFVSVVVNKSEMTIYCSECSVALPVLPIAFKDFFQVLPFLLLVLGIMYTTWLTVRMERIVFDCIKIESSIWGLYNSSCLCLWEWLRFV